VETVAAVMPGDRKEREDLLFQTLETGKDLQDLPKYYAPLASVARELLAHALPPEAFVSHLGETDAATFNAAVLRTGVDPKRIRVVPISSHRGDATMLVDAENARPLRPVAVDPWPAFSARHAAAAPDPDSVRPSNLREPDI
jgi:hypothetical protein